MFLNQESTNQGGYNYVYQNGTQLFKGAEVTQWNMNDTSQTYGTSSDLTVAMGDTIDFVSHMDKGEQLTATITETTVPEPSTLVLLALGLIGLLAYAWRKRR